MGKVEITMLKPASLLLVRQGLAVFRSAIAVSQPNVWHRREALCGKSETA
jgi:hypothetical protein